MTVPAMGDPLIGVRVGPCRLERRLAAGGMGVVYRAQHVPTGQDVALKILAPSMASDQEYVARFFREAGAAGQIDHPGVVRVIDVGRDGDKYFMVMEYVSGETLDAVLERERRVPFERATRLIRDVADGLEAAHKAGIIHRDVKPGNIIVSPDGKPHLTDFGLARQAGNQKGLTIEGTFLGTPEYASPEQVEGRKLDHRTDLYSLGVSYYQLLSGTLPFLGDSPMEIAIKRTKDPARPLSHAFPGADPRGCAVVDRLLQLHPADRYASAGQLIRDLDAILGGGRPASARKGDTPSRAAKPLPPPGRIRSAAHWGLVALAVLSAFASGILSPRWTLPEVPAWAALGTSLASGVVALLVYRRELSSAGGMGWPMLGILLMVAGGWAGGAFLDRSEPATLLIAPVNVLAVGLFFLFVGAFVAFEHEPGGLRVLVSRVAVAAGFVLVYAFSAGGSDWGAPFREFMTQPAISIPLATGTGVACFFGLILMTGYDSSPSTRWAGTVLCLLGALGLHAVGTVLPGRGLWHEAMLRPLPGLGTRFLSSGTPLVGVAAAALVSRSRVAAGLKRRNRPPR